MAEAEVIETDADPASGIDERARRMGWRPEEEWDDSRGTRRPAKFLTAEEYLDKVANDLPVLRERNRFLDETVVKLDRQVGEMGARLTETGELVKTLHEQNKQIGERARAQARRELEEEQRNAVLEADPEKFDAAKARLAELDKPSEPARETPPVPVPTPKPAPTQDPVVTAWRSENQWFDKDQTLNAYAIEENINVNRETPGISASEALAETKRRVMEKFPEKFGINPRRSAPSAVQTPGAPRDAKRGNGKSFDDLPEEAKTAFSRLQKNMKERGVDYKPEEYLADYAWD